MGKAKDLTGKRFGRLVAVSVASHDKGRTHWNCQCDCGNTTTARTDNLHCGDKVSCGCYSKEISKAVGKRNRKHGYAGTSTYNIYKSMLQRCANPKNQAYEHYGNRGIVVCDRWKKSFENFLADMGERPDGMSVERRNNNKGYSPDNCYWATRIEQANNTRRNVSWKVDGVTRTISEWAKAVGLSVSTLHARVAKLGWSIDDAVKTPLRGQSLPNSPGAGF